MIFHVKLSCVTRTVYSVGIITYTFGCHCYIVHTKSCIKFINCMLFVNLMHRSTSCWAPWLYQHIRWIYIYVCVNICTFSYPQIRMFHCTVYTNCINTHCSFDYNTPYIVTLGMGYIIPGMDQGLVGTCLYERRRITFPASLGYGQSGVGEKIPPNATLTFYIRMVKIIRVSITICIYTMCIHIMNVHVYVCMCIYMFVCVTTCMYYVCIWLYVWHCIYIVYVLCSISLKWSSKGIFTKLKFLRDIKCVGNSQYCIVFCKCLQNLTSVKFSSSE